jgi:hypothetical protein
MREVGCEYQYQTIAPHPAQIDNRHLLQRRFFHPPCETTVDPYPGLEQTHPDYMRYFLHTGGQNHPGVASPAFRTAEMEPWLGCWQSKLAYLAQNTRAATRLLIPIDVCIKQVLSLRGLDASVKLPRACHDQTPQIKPPSSMK